MGLTFYQFFCDYQLLSTCVDGDFVHGREFAAQIHTPLFSEYLKSPTVRALVTFVLISRREISTWCLSYSDVHEHMLDCNYK